MTDRTKARFNLRMNTSLDETGQAMIQQLAKVDAVSEASIIRQLISQRFRMKFDQQPVCATGINCLCPQMHVPTLPRSESDTELLQRVASPGPDA